VCVGFVELISADVPARRRFFTLARHVNRFASKNSTGLMGSLLAVILEQLTSQGVRNSIRSG
jgi:hypothetical protein